MKKILLTISLGLAMLFTKAQNTGWVVGDGGLLRKTTDAGLTWTIMNTTTVGQQFGSANIKTIDFTDLNNGWIAGDGGLLRKTIDGGLTWTIMNTTIVGQQFGSANIMGINFIKEITTRVSEEKLNQISLFPNPASTFFTLNNVIERTSISVMDVTGKIIVSNSVIDADKTMTIETSNLSNGVYMIQLKNNGAVAHRKLIISK